LKQQLQSAAYFFLLDKTDIRKREEAVRRILAILHELKSREPEVFELLGRYITGYLSYRGVESREITEYITERGRPMLLQSMDKMYEQAKKEGLEKGIQEGIEEGRREGKLEDKREMLIRQLDLRFGLKEEEAALIRKEQAHELLNSCLDKILFSNTKEEVLAILNKE
jgi:predicted transposase/invertase (TIGR01784 family)